MSRKQRIEQLGIFNLEFEGSSLEEETVKRMEIIQRSPQYSKELFQRINEDGLIFSMDNFKSTHQKWVAVDGSNSYFSRETTLDVYFDVAAAAVLNPSEFTFSYLDFYRGYPYRISRSDYYPRFPHLIRDCAEYKAINTISKSDDINIDLLLSDGSVIGGVNWFARRYEGLNEEGSLTVNRSAFVETIEVNLLPIYREMIQLASEIPILYFPKSSMSRGLIRYYLPNLLQGENGFQKISDIYLLGGLLKEGQYILPNFSLNDMMSDVGTISKFRKEMDEFRSIFFQAGNTRYNLPLRFEIHENWLDDIDSMLNLIHSLYDNRMQMLGPLVQADNLARKLINNPISEAVEFSIYRACLEMCETEEEKLRLVKLFNPYRFDRT